MKQSKNINMTLKATLSVATAITAATSLPAGIIQQVLALDNTNNPITVPQTTTEPTRKTELANELKQKDAELFSASTALQGAKDAKELAETNVKNAKDDIAKNDDSISTAKKEIDDILEYEYTLREKEMNDAKASFDTLNGQKTDLIESIKQNQEIEKEQNEALTEAKTNKENLEDDYKLAIGNIDSVKTAKQASENNVISFNRKIEELDTQIAAKNADLNNVIKTLANEDYTTWNKDKYNEEISKANERIKQRKTDLETSQKELDLKKTERDGYQEELEKLEAIESKSEEEQSRMEILKLKISNLDSSIKLLQNEIDGFNSDITMCQANINTANQEIAKLKEIESITAEINSNTTQKTQFQQVRDSQQEKVENYTEIINSYNKTIDDYKVALATYNDALDAHESTLSSISDAQSQLNELEPKIEAAEKVSNEKNTRFSNIETAISQWNDIKAKYSNNSNSLKIVVQNSTPFGPFDGDTTLTDLIETVNNYIAAQENVSVLNQNLQNANDSLAIAINNLSNAQKNYDDALVAYNNAKDNYDLFVQTHGNITEETITTIETSKYTGKEINPAVVVKDSFGNTVDASEYSVTYSSNTEPGTATVTVTMDGVNYVGQFVKTFKIYGYITEDTISTIESSKYTGNSIVPDITVKDNQGNIIDKSEYTVSYENNIEPGIATVKVVMNGEKYDGEFTKKFEIIKDPVPVKKDTTTPTVTNSSKETTVKTSDEAPIVGFSLMAMLSSAMYFFTKKKKEKE